MREPINELKRAACRKETYPFRQAALYYTAVHLERLVFARSSRNLIRNRFLLTERF